MSARFHSYAFMEVIFEGKFHLSFVFICFLVKDFYKYFTRKQRQQMVFKRLHYCLINISNL
jgi:hypothetical protein